MDRRPSPEGSAPGPAPPPRVVIEDVEPRIDGGRFPIKRCLGERVEVTASVFADGHDVLTVLLLWRPPGEAGWREAPMELADPGLDLWRGAFPLEGLGLHLYTVTGWVDRFRTWLAGLQKKQAAGALEALDLLRGLEMLEAAAGRAPPGEARALRERAAALRPAPGADLADLASRALDPALLLLMSRHAERPSPARFERELGVWVDRERARFSAWYEMFPRSASPQPGRHGTLRDVEERLPYVAEMGFDILYLPPIHPIGEERRKGRNNAPRAEPGDPGSPWAVGSPRGGHRAIHPELGTPEDFHRLLRRAGELGIEVALDLAFQCAPDHPYVREHPGWFQRRPDGSIQYAENPPKKYEDIYPLDFEGPAWRELWEELREVVLHWVGEGVRAFRVDNPHTKPFRFWEWLLGEVRREHPEVIFLSEAFTRPRVQYHLAKLGFTQSYTYFAWRNTPGEIEEYFTELTQGEAREYFRPSLWPTTPDILPEYLQWGGPPAFAARLILAATLGASYGIYGPAFELGEARGRSPGSEEYHDSEKYQLRHWDLERPDSLRHLIARVNRIRRENPALQSDQGLRFHRVDAPHLVAYTKATPDLSNVILMVVNVDPHHSHGGWLELPLEDLGISPRAPYQVHDLLSGSRFIWSGPRNFVAPDSRAVPAHILRLRRRVRSEHDFAYFL